MLIAFKRPDPFSFSVTSFPFPVRTYDLDHSFMEVAALARLARAFGVKLKCSVPVCLLGIDKKRTIERYC